MNHVTSMTCLKHGRRLVRSGVPVTRDSVTSIGGGAFSGCSSLVNVHIPDSVASICE